MGQNYIADNEEAPLGQQPGSQLLPTPKPPRAKVLLTAFGPFKNIVENPTAVLLHELSQAVLLADDEEVDENHQPRTLFDEDSLRWFRERVDATAVVVEVSCQAVDATLAALRVGAEGAERPSAPAASQLEQMMAVFNTASSNSEDASGSGDRFRHLTGAKRRRLPPLAAMQRAAAGDLCSEGDGNMDMHQQDQIGVVPLLLPVPLSLPAEPSSVGDIATREDEPVKNVSSSLAIHFGVYAGSEVYNVECRGVNFMQLEQTPDVRGVRRSGRIRICETSTSSTSPSDLHGDSESDCLYTSIDVDNVVARLQEKGFTEVAVSNDAGTYLCNYAYYESLRKCRNTLFVHVPTFAEMLRVEIKTQAQELHQLKV
eukprot:g6863.t1